VPARHEVNVPVKMTDRDIPHPARNWVIETKQLSSRIMTARTLVDGRQKRLVARVCNYSNEPFELKANYCLARAEPVECIPRPGEKSQNADVVAATLFDEIISRVSVPFAILTDRGGEFLGEGACTV